MTDDDVERVARALAAAEFGSDVDLDVWMSRPEFAGAYRKLARAAIEAMTIPIIDLSALGE
jgi:hypothetical protein